MERSKVVCHMYVSIDGKIDGRYMDEEGSNPSGAYYDEALWRFGEANGNGRATAQMYFANAEIDYAQYEGADVPKGDNVLKYDNYWVVFDRKGRCDWAQSEVTYGGKTAKVVEVITKKVGNEFRAHLRKLGIAYIEAGEEDFDLELALKKLKSLFGIETLVLTGGALINGAFLKAHLLDELSLVVAPYIEGNHDEKGYAELSEFINDSFVFVSAKPLEDGGVHLLFKRK